MNTTINEKLSAMGCIWQEAEFDERLTSNFEQHLNCSKILAQILSSKEIKFEELESFLNPKLKDFPSPFSLLDIDKGIEKTIAIIQNKQKIIIFGDYDVDGACSSAILKKFFDHIGADSQIYIPDRLTEGYGPNLKAIESFAEQKIDLCIFVDCGSVAFEPLQKAAELNLDTIVIDHHLSGEVLPPTCALINPNRLDENSEYGNLCAAGVVFFFISALKIRLKEIDFFKQNNLPEINLSDFLDLAALATVCDIVSLTGINRLLVSAGLKVMQQKQNLGLRHLISKIKLDSPITTYHLGYMLGPRINAGGRVAQSDLGATLLSTEDPEIAEEIAQKLDFFNNERKEIEQQVLQEAMQKVVDEEILQNRKVIMVSGNWHPGVIGIVASRLKEKFNLPTIVVAVKDEIGKTSCRGIKTIDFGATVLEARSKELIIEGGGHKMAAGFSFIMEKYAQVYDFFDQKFAAGVDLHLRQKERFFAADINLSNLNVPFFNEINRLAPFGMGNSEPVFKISNVKIAQPRLLAEKHLSFLMFDDNRQSKKAIAFNSADNKIGQIISNNSEEKFDIIGKINLNFWKGNHFIQFVVQDLICN